MEPADINQPGTGGGLGYLAEEPSAGIGNQEQSHSCQAACARQLLADAGVQVSEAELLDRIGYLEGWGTTAGDTARILNELHPTLGYAGGPVNPEAAETFFQRDPWGLAGPGSGTGTRATIALGDFHARWVRAVNNAVFPNRRK